MKKTGDDTDDKKHSGTGIGSTAILYALVAKGEEVLIPWADHLRYDLAFVRYEGGFLSTKEPRLYRVQCKMARLTDDGSCIIFNAFNTIPGEGGRRAGDASA